MASTNASWRCCCTCEFWRGQRELSGLGDRVEYDHRSVEGDCNEGSWDWGGQGRTALSTCTGWRQWATLEQVEVS